MRALSNDNLKKILPILLGLAFALFLFTLAIKSLEKTSSEANLPKIQPIAGPPPVQPNTEPPVFKSPPKETLKYKDRALCTSANLLDTTKTTIFTDKYLVTNACDDKPGLLVVNLADGKATNLFEQPVMATTGGSRPLDLGPFKIVGTDLYVSFGGYLRQGVLFVLDLTQENPVPKEVVRMENPTVVNFGNDYFVRGGEGDACWHYSFYKKLDLEKKETVGKKLEFKVECEGGMEMVDYDSQLQSFLFADIDRVKLFKEPANVPDDGFGIEYKSLGRISTTGERTLLLSKEISEKISQMFYDPKDRKVYLIGLKSLYSYDLLTSSLKLVGEIEIPKTDGANIYNLNFQGMNTGGGICARLNNSTQTFVYDHTTAKILPNAVYTCNPPENELKLTDLPKDITVSVE